jgi:hypothetical protein
MRSATVSRHLDRSRGALDGAGGGHGGTWNQGRRDLAAGAEGERIGSLVAERLGFRYVDEEIITRAAEKQGVDPRRWRMPNAARA